MSEKKYVVPIDMLRAVRAECYRNSTLPKQLTDEQILLAALRWLSENPIVPTQSQLIPIVSAKIGFSFKAHDWIRWGACEWQRRMFLAPEPEVPEEIRDLLRPKGEWEWLNDAVIEAYRRGQKNRT